MSQQTKHILVIRFSAMGDVAMTVPVICALTQQHPNLKVTILTRAFFNPFFKGLKNVQIINADLKGKHKGLLGLYRLSKDLKKQKFDAVADLHNVLRSNVLKRLLIKVPFVQIDKGRKEKKDLVSGVNFTQLKTTHQRYADVFEKLGFQIDLSISDFPTASVLNDKLQKVIQQNSKQLIGIAPFAAFQSKMYPLDLMTQVITNLSEDYQILLFGGGKEEEKQLDVIASQNKNVFNLAGKLSLDEELDIISNLDLMLSMDSGNGHLAAMLGVKVISIWGTTHPYAGFLPFNHSIDSCLLADRKTFPKIPTSVYGNKFPEGYEKAIASILPSSIIEKVRATL